MDQLTAKRLASVALVVAVAALASACDDKGDGNATGKTATAEKPASAPESAPAPKDGKLEGSADGVSVTLQLDPPLPPMGSMFAVETTVVDASGKPLDPETFSLDAGMPAHRHGMVTQPKHEELEPGKFRSEGMKFHMPGEWMFTVELDTDGGKKTVELPYNQSPVTNDP